MKAVWVLLLAAVATSCVYAHGADDGHSHVIELTDVTFEARTQAATGGTAGDWFVVLYAHTRSMAAIHVSDLVSLLFHKTLALRRGAATART